LEFTEISVYGSVRPAVANVFDASVIDRSARPSEVSQDVLIVFRRWGGHHRLDDRNLPALKPVIWISGHCFLLVKTGLDWPQSLIEYMVLFKP
jgi:hypothetical protein